MKNMSKTKKALVGVGVATTLMVGEAFVGDIDWLNIMDLPNESSIRKAAAPIGAGYQNVDGYVGRCNYWSVGERLVLTNGHCINNQNAKGITVFFTENKNRGITCEKMLAYSPWEKYDYLLLECNEDIPDSVILDPKYLEVGHKLLHISHNCDYYTDSNCEIEPKYDNTEECRVFESSIRGGLDFTQGCDSIGGSSGSPMHSRELFSDGYHVVGLHHSGYFYQDSRGEEEGRGTQNGTVYLQPILNDIIEKTGIDLMARQRGRLSPPPVITPIDDSPAPITEEPSPRVSLWRALLQALIDWFTN